MPELLFRSAFLSRLQRIKGYRFASGAPTQDRFSAHLRIAIGSTTAPGVVTVTECEKWLDVPRKPEMTQGTLHPLQPLPLTHERDPGPGIGIPPSGG